MAANLLLPQGLVVARKFTLECIQPVHRGNKRQEKLQRSVLVLFQQNSYFEILPENREFWFFSGTLRAVCTRKSEHRLGDSSNLLLPSLAQMHLMPSYHNKRGVFH